MDLYGEASPTFLQIVFRAFMAYGEAFISKDPITFEKTITYSSELGESPPEPGPPSVQTTGQPLAEPPVQTVVVNGEVTVGEVTVVEEELSGGPVGWVAFAGGVGGTVFYQSAPTSWQDTMGGMAYDFVAWFGYDPLGLYNTWYDPSSPPSSSGGGSNGSGGSGGGSSGGADYSAGPGNVFGDPGETGSHIIKHKKNGT